ncbi:MFS transporter [Brevibacillus daliensis]|uniref:MFS transporter n=1 Tax=Brevibacillus daliensis TaxID=2892995 RepID=UPI001E42B30B|nr:MFS transporter [Brevibacillus daliensis]
MTWFSRYPKEAYAFIAANMVNSIGGAMMWPLTTLYVKLVMGHSYADAGLVLLLQSLAGIIGQFCSGFLYFRLGVRRLLVLVLLVDALILLGIILIKIWWVYVLLMFLFGFANALFFPAIQSFIGFRWREQSRELFNVIYVSNNVGMAIGSSLGGLLAAISFNLSYGITFITTLFFAFFLSWFLRRVGEQQSFDELTVDARSSLSRKETFSLLKNIRLYLFLGLGSMMLWLGLSVWSMGIAPYLNDQGMSPAAYSLLWTLNGIIILVGQPVTYLIKKYLAPSLTSQMIASGLFYSIAMLLMLLWHNYTLIVISMAIATFGEMLKAPAVPSFITENARENAPFYLGIVGSIASVGRLLGPLIMGNTYDHGGIEPVQLIGVIGAVIATLLLTVHASLQRRSDDNFRSQQASSSL